MIFLTSLKWEKIQNKKKERKGLVTTSIPFSLFLFESSGQASMHRSETMLLFQGDNVLSPAMSRLTRTGHPQFRTVTPRAERAPERKSPSLPQDGPHNPETCDTSAGVIHLVELEVA